MRRLVCAFVVRKPRKTGFLAARPICNLTILQGQFAPVKGNYSQEFKDLVMTMLNQDPSDRPSAHQLMYIDLPKVCPKT